MDTPSLRELLAAPVEIPVGSIKLPVRPMGWMLAADAIDELLPVVDELPMQRWDGETEQEYSLRWVRCIAEHRAEIGRFVALASSQPLEDVNAIEPMHLVELLLGLIELNAGFFMRGLPTLMGRATRVLQALEDSARQAERGFTTSSSA